MTTLQHVEAAFTASGNIPDTIVRGTRVLLDKDGALVQMPSPSRPPAPQPPDAAMFREALDNFWFHGVYCAKQLRRGELWMFQNSSVGMQWRLLQMIEWHANVVHGAEYDTWHGGKFVAEWADADVVAFLIWDAHLPTRPAVVPPEKRINPFNYSF